MLTTIGVIRKTLAAIGLAALVLAQSSPVSAGGQLAAAGGSPSAPEGPFARNFTFSDLMVPAPSTTFHTLEGAAVSFADFRGKLLLVNFWATWCAPCVEEMPALERLHSELADEGLAVLAVSQDRDGAAVVEPFLARIELQQLPVYLDATGVLGRAFALKGLPTTFLIDREGRVLAGLVGPAEWDSPEALAFLRHYLQRAEMTNTSG